MAKQVLCVTQRHNDGSVSLHFAPEGQAFVQGRPGFASTEAARLKQEPTITEIEGMAELLKAAHEHHATMSRINSAKEADHERLVSAIAHLSGKIASAEKAPVETKKVAHKDRK